jgi:hypothetical protein
MATKVQLNRKPRLASRSERLALHHQNCHALAEAYAQVRGKSPRVIQQDIDAFLQAVTVERELWEANFCPQQFLDRLSPMLRRRYHLF